MIKSSPVDSWELGSRVRRMDLPLTPENPIQALIKERPADPAPAFDVHNACEVGVVLQGRYQRFHEGLTREVGPGQMWVCGVWEPHGGWTVATPTRAVNITFLPEALVGGAPDAPPWGALLRGHSTSNRDITLTREEAGDAARIALELVKECSGVKPWNLYAARLALRRLLLPLMRRVEPWTAQGQGAGFERIEGVIRMVARRLPAKITIAAAARHAHLSRSRFAAIFKQATGVAFGEFVRRARVARAARELAGSEIKLAAVARRCGYADASHLHRSFLRFFRCTPAEYRSRRRPG